MTGRAQRDLLDKTRRNPRDRLEAPHIEHVSPRRCALFSTWSLRNACCSARVSNLKSICVALSLSPYPAFIILIFDLCPQATVYLLHILRKDSSPIHRKAKGAAGEVLRRKENFLGTLTNSGSPTGSFAFSHVTGGSTASIDNLDDLQAQAYNGL